jgi:hypothetical protein
MSDSYHAWYSAENDKVYLGVVSKFMRSEQKDPFGLDILDEYDPYRYIEDY